MALSPMYFQVLSPQQANPLGYGIQQGTEIGNNIIQARARALQNQQLQAQLPYAGQMAQADLANKQVQAPYVQSQTALNEATLPYLNMKYSAPMLMAQSRMMQAGIQNSNAFRQWTQTPEGAAYVAQNPGMADAITQAMQNSAGMINGGYMPTGNNNPMSYPTLPGATPNMQGTPITPDQVGQLRNLMQHPMPTNGMQPSMPVNGMQGAPANNMQSSPVNDIQNVASLQALHKTTDAAARQKNLYATNIEKTLNQINPDDLTQYAGALGTAQRYGQTALAALPGHQESQNYDNYKKSLNAANLLATQVRQFYGDSIQPSMIQRLEALTNSSTWSNNPTLAKALFNETKQILGMETGTYRDAMKSTAPYQAQNPQQPQNQMPSVSKVLNGTTYHKINGQWYAQ